MDFLSARPTPFVEVRYIREGVRWPPVQAEKASGPISGVERLMRLESYLNKSVVIYNYLLSINFEKVSIAATLVETKQLDLL